MDAIFALIVGWNIELIDPYQRFPPARICQAAAHQAAEDYRQYAEAMPWIRSWSPHRVEEAMLCRDESYRLWDAWLYVGRIRANIDREHNEHLLRLLIGDSRFEAGDIPLPISWR